MQDRLPPDRRTSCNARPDHTSRVSSIVSSCQPVARSSMKMTCKLAWRADSRLTKRHIGVDITPPLNASSPERDDASSNRHPAPILLFAHDPFGKPASTFPDHALKDNL